MPTHPNVANPSRLCQPAQSSYDQPAQSWPTRHIIAKPPCSGQTAPSNRGQPNPSSPIHQIQSWTIRPFVANRPIVANPTHRGQPTPSYRGELAQSCHTAPSCPTGSIQSMAAAQSCLTCPIVAGPPFHGHPAPCNRGEPTPLRLIHYMSSKPRHPICQPALSWLTRPIAANPRQCNREHASSSQRHASRAKPGQCQARLRPSQPLPRQAKLI